MRIPLSTLMLGLVLGGCSSVQESQLPVQLVTAPAEHSQASEVMPIKQLLRPGDVLDVIFHLNTSSDGPYRIQRGDHLEMMFLTASELNGTRIVMPDGVVDMPYVGAIEVAGLSVADAQRKVIEQYSRVLRRPEIVVSVARPMAQLENLRMTLNHPATGMSREITVGADGRASFPLVGTLALQGKSVEDVVAELNQLYAAEFGEIRADVLLKSTVANEVYVLGAVTQPGAYPVRRPVSVLEALTMAQGPLLGANLETVAIMRRRGNEVAVHLYDVDAALKGQAQTFAYLQPDDLIYVPKTRLTRAGEVSRQLADVVLFQGVGFSFSYRVDNKDDD